MRTLVPSLLLLSLATALALPLRADTITGRVVNSNGVGVAGVDIDANNLGSGGNPHITNDGTDANGFFTTTIDSGVFQILFKPPTPPASTLLTAIVNNVVVSGTKNMGVITLQTGVAVSGKTIDSNGAPLANVKVVVTDVPTGAVLVMNNSTTDSFGTFAVAVPAHAIHFDLDPINIVTRTLVARRLELAPSANVNLGNLTLASGFVLSGTVKRSTGVALSGVDMDVFDSASGVRLFTPHDNTDSLGAFAIALTPGTYDLKASPAFALHLVSAEVFALPFTANTNAGTVTLASGVVLSGTVRATNGSPVADVDVNVKQTVSRQEVVLSADNTSATGAYAVIVPLGTFDVGFAFPGHHGTSGENLHTALVVSGNTVLDGVMPAPAAAFSGTPLTGAPPLLVSFSDASTGAVTGWSWNFGDATTSTAQSPTHLYTQPGTYTVSLTVSGPGGPSTQTRNGYVVVGLSGPVAEFSASTRRGKAPLSVQFSDLSSGSVTSWSWNFGDSASASVQNPAHVYRDPGVYSVTLTVSGPGGSNGRTKVDYVVVLGDAGAGAPRGSAAHPHSFP